MPHSLFPRLGGLFFLPLLAGCPVAAQTGAPAPTAPTTLTEATKKCPVLVGGTSLLPTELLGGFRLSGDQRIADVRAVDVQGQLFKRALQIQTIQKPDREYALRLVAPLSPRVEAGDVVVATFWMRGLQTQDEGGEALSAFVVENSTTPFTKSADVSLQAPLGEEWKMFRLPFTVKETLEAGKGNVHFRLGSAVQTFQIGGLSLQNYGTAVKLSDFPRVVETYAGREPDAPWRKSAAEGIDKLRKGDLKLRVVDAAGKPVSNAQIEVRMKRHAFGFGSVVNLMMCLRHAERMHSLTLRVRVGTTSRQN